MRFSHQQSTPSWKVRLESLVKAPASRQGLRSRLLGPGSRQAAIDPRWRSGLTCGYASCGRPRRGILVRKPHRYLIGISCASRERISRLPHFAIRGITAMSLAPPVTEPQGLIDEEEARSRVEGHLLMLAALGTADEITAYLRTTGVKRVPWL